MRKLLWLLPLFACFFLSSAPKAHAATAYVKGCETSNSSITTIDCTFSGNVTNGDAIACFVQWNDATQTFTSLTQTSGTATVGTFTEPNTVVNSVTAHSNQGYALVTGTGTAVIRLTLSGAITSAAMIICHDVSGVATSSPLDVSALVNQSAPGTGTDGVTTGASPTTSTVNGDYLFSGCYDIGGNSSTTAAGTGYTVRDLVNVGGRMTESQVQATAGSFVGSYTATGGGADIWQVGVMALKPSTLGPPPPPGPISPVGIL